MTTATLLDRITSFYLNSRDFNGLPVRDLDIPTETLRPFVKTLVESGLASINFGDIHPNPHVQALDPEPPEQQLAKLESPEFAGACLYPTPAHLRTVVDPATYQDRPFTLRLALGEPQLRPCFFDLTVLEIYRNDPRYHYDTDDISGHISVKSQHYETGDLASSDEVLLQTFGFAYDAAFNRAVATYLWYLSQLSPEHQRIWEAKRLSGDYELHPDYHRQTMGHWAERVSIFSAFTEELFHINELSQLMRRPPLFREDYREDKRPRTFAFLIRPTLKEFNDFVHLLDKMLSDNINLDFFQDDVSRTEEITRPDGRVEVRPKGSIRVLEEWITGLFHPKDPKPMAELFATLRRVRKLRQQPAHAVKEDVFDQQYFKDQRGVMLEAYKAVRTLRHILENHPAGRGYQVPDWLRKGEIWTF
jgi:hypothetical protein